MSKALRRNGTRSAHNREWPLYEQPSFTIEVDGFIDQEDLSDPSGLEARLNEILDDYGVTVKVGLVTRLVMSPEDKAEMIRLDELAVAGLSHMIS